MEFFELIKEDLSSLGGPMGTEHTTEIFRKAFESDEKAKAFAEKDNKKYKNGDPIHWVRQGRGWYSGDLRSHDYTISVRKIE